MPGGAQSVAAVGEILWDMLPDGKQLGGAPANFIYHVREIGGGGFKTMMVSCIGEDPLGREILDRWGRLSLSGEFIAVDAEHPTGTVAVSLDGQGRPVYRIETDVAWDFLPESPRLKELSAAADAVCFGTLAQRGPKSRKSIRNFLRNTKPDALRILDLNLRKPFFSKDIVEESLQLADVVKVNGEELRVLADYFSISGGEESMAAGLLRRWRLRLVALTRGEGGSLLCAPGARAEHRGYAVTVADTVGAGDAFCAAIAVGMLRGFPLEKLNDCANRAASFVCTQPGAMPAMPEEIRRLFL